MSNCLYLDDSYITKFDFMNNNFAKLVLALLYPLVLKQLALGVRIKNYPLNQV